MTILTTVLCRTPRRLPVRFESTSFNLHSPRCARWKSSHWNYWNSNLHQSTKRQNGGSYIEVALTKGETGAHRPTDLKRQVADSSSALQRSRREDSSASFLTAALTSTSTFTHRPLHHVESFATNGRYLWDQGKSADPIWPLIDLSLALHGFLVVVLLRFRERRIFTGGKLY